MDVIKSDKGANIGANIRRIRLESDISQTNLVRILQLMGADTIREALMKIEKKAQHIKASRLKAIKAALGTSYEDLLEQEGKPYTQPEVYSPLSVRAKEHPHGINERLTGYPQNYPYYPPETLDISYKSSENTRSGVVYN